MFSSIDLTAMPYYYRGRVIRMDISQTMKDEVVFYNWKMMKLDRCRATWGMGENYEFPNGIRVHFYLGKRPVKIQANVEQAREVESLVGGMKYTRKPKKGRIEFSVPFGNRGEYLDLLWDLYMIGGERHHW
jgi:hypothetical protein